MEGKNGVCRIEVSKVDWQVLQPWQRTSQKKSTGSGFVIDGERLITNAHVVKSAVDIRVRPLLNPMGKMQSFWTIRDILDMDPCPYTLFKVFIHTLDLINR